MRIHIYYGGRGIIDDPTNYVINKIQEVLEELNVSVERYNLHEQKNMITTLPHTLKEADGVILATTVEWYGIGGYMQQFLDACWLYGDKEKISKLYMCPVVMSTTYGEREGKLNLATAWEILGGVPCSGICGYIADTVTLEMNEDYTRLIEKNAENLYRTIHQKMPNFPTSNQAVKQKIAITKNLDLTPQETEQLSQYAADDKYVKRQKEDIQELASLFKGMMETKETEDGLEYISDFERNFTPQTGFRATYKFVIEGKKKPLGVQVSGGELNCFYGAVERADVELQLSKATMQEIISSRMTFQRAFMSGEMKMKGDFSLFRLLDELFPFEE